LNYPKLGTGGRRFLQRYPFLEYAAQFWGVHARTAYDDEIQAESVRFVSSRAKMCLWNCLTPDWRPRSKLINFLKDLEPPSAIEVAAFYKLDLLARPMLCSSEGLPKATIAQQASALLIACGNGSAEITNLLLAQNPSILDLSLLWLVR